MEAPPPMQHPQPTRKGDPQNPSCAGDNAMRQRESKPCHGDPGDQLGRCQHVHDRLMNLMIEGLHFVITITLW